MFTFASPILTMSHITLIATTHTEIGLCNSHELFKIIEKVNPDVIFEEIPPGKFEAVYAGTRQGTLETQAIKTYLQKYPATHHNPVDLDIEQPIEMEIRNEVCGIDFICKDYNTEYKYLSGLTHYWQEVHGFRYLNTDKCSELISRKKTLEREILEQLKKDKNHKSIDHENLILAYKQWLDQIEERENEILRNIYRYMETKKYSRAVFLVGAAHRKPIMQKIQEYESKEAFKLNWEYYS